MRNFGFANSSKKMLESAHEDIKIILEEVKKVCMIDFDLSCVHRTEAEQKAAFLNGKSQLDGVKRKSKHQELPSKAFDIYAYKEGGKASWSREQICYIAGVIQTIANSLYIKGKIKHTIRWGGNWDSDQWIITDQVFQDLCHFELMEM